MFFCIQIPQDLQDATISQLQPMSISVQPGGAPPVYIVRPDSSSKDAVNKDNPPNGAQRNAAEQDITKPKTLQHLLCDWRTAYTQSKKVIFIYLF